MAEGWTVDDVATFLEKLELHALVAAFKENAVNGKDLLTFSDDDLKEYLGAKPLQIRKIRNSLPGPGAAPTATAPTAAVTPTGVAAAGAPANTAAREAGVAYPSPPPAGYPPAPAPYGYPPPLGGAPAPALAPVVASAPPVAAAPGYGPGPGTSPAPEAADKAAKLQAQIADLQQEAAGLGQKADEAQKQAGACTQAASLLKQANAKLEGAIKALKGVQVSGVVDMRRDVRTGIAGARHDVGFAGRRMMMHNPGQTMLEMGLVQKANDACKSAGQDIAQAKAILPAMPGIPEGSVQSAKSGVFANVLMPGIGGEMAQMAMVKKGMGEVEGMMRGVGQALQWTAQQQAAAEGQAQQLRMAATGKQAEADACKRMLA